MSLRLPVTPAVWSAFETLAANRVQYWTIEDDEVLRVTWKHEALRSDTHQVVVGLSSSFIKIFGSPARVESGDNVFGPGDPVHCARRMIQFVEKTAGVQLPDVHEWDCTRMDVTVNFWLGDLAAVRAALRYYRDIEGGHLRVRSSGETAYINRGSDLVSGKIYPKGPHLRHLVKKGKAEVREDYLAMADGLMRLEMTLGSRYWRRHQEQGRRWHQFTENDLHAEHDQYFARVIGGTAIMTNVSDNGVLEALLKVAPTKRRAVAAHRTWLQIRANGPEVARELLSNGTWYRHRNLLFAAGLSYADFQARKVVEFRKAHVVAKPVSSWAELEQLAA